jgi:hypothetical protein
MKRVVLTSTAVIALIGSTGIAAAYDHSSYRHSGTNTPLIDATLAQQVREIEIARKRGQLTWREYFALKREQAHIEQMVARAKRDGVVTWPERAETWHAQQDAQKHIYQEAHHAETRATRHARWWWMR